MLAEMGYVALAPDYSGEPALSLNHALEIMKRLIQSPQLYVEHGQAALAVLRAHGHVDGEGLAAIGSAGEDMLSSNRRAGSRCAA